MKSFKEYLAEGKEEAAHIRGLLKSKLGLSSRDVSVKSSYGGSSSSVNVDIKTIKALVQYGKIEEIGKGKESYQRDAATGEILAGGNTFIFVAVDYKFAAQLDKMIQAEWNKQVVKIKDHKPVKMFNTFSVSELLGGNYVISMKGSPSYEVRNPDHVGSELRHWLLNRVKNYDLFKKIK